KKLIFNYNIGHMEQTDRLSSCFYIANMSFLINSKLHFFIENFGDLHHKKLMSHNLNIGGGYNFTDKLILNISVNNSLNKDLFYAGGRITWIINTKKTKT
ncbi:MAG: hypothetical protein RQ864_08970, partial [Lutibacter sp.]|nr:hypothetical protein [Lutibacter sp.]